MREESRRDYALEFFARIRAQAASATPPPLGIHLLLGPTVKQKTANMIDAVRNGTIEPIQMIFGKV